MTTRSGPEELLHAIDAELSKIAAEGQKLPLYILGRASLILSLGSRESTKDVDVIQDDSALLASALELAGKGSPLAASVGMYLESVGNGFPPLPPGYERRAVPIPGDWQILMPFRLDFHDLVVSKLKRFYPQDQQDIRSLCNRDEIDPDILRERFENAFMWYPDPDNNPDRRSAEIHLATVLSWLEG